MTPPTPQHINAILEGVKVMRAHILSYGVHLCGLRGTGALSDVRSLLGLTPP